VERAITVTTNDRSTIRKLVDAYADDFERALRLEGPYKDEGYRLVRRTEKIISYLRKLKGQRLLDVGCGPGVVAVKINKELGLKVDAVDFSEKQVKKARKRVEAEKADVRIFHEDIMSPSGNSGLHYESYDIVLCKDVIAIYRTDSKKAFLKELVKYVKPGGHLVMSVLTGETHPYLYGESPDSYRSMVKEISETEAYMETLDEEALLIDLAVENRVGL